MPYHGFKDFVDYIKAVREESETGIKDPRLIEVKPNPLTEEEMSKIETWIIKTFPEPCVCGHDLIEHDVPDNEMLFCRVKDCTCINFQHLKD